MRAERWIPGLLSIYPYKRPLWNSPSLVLRTTPNIRSRLNQALRDTVHLTGSTAYTEPAARIAAEPPTGLRLFGIALTMVQRSRLSETVAEQARKHFGDRLFESEIPRLVAIAEAPLDGAPIVIGQKPNKSNPGSKAYWDC